MQTKDLSQVFASATSISNTDELLFLSPSGFGRIPRGKLASTLEFNITDGAGTGKWVRIAELNSYSMGMVYITNTWSSTQTSPICFVVLSAHPKAIGKSAVIPLSSSLTCPKARIVYNASQTGMGTTLYLEVFMQTLTQGDKVTVVFDMTSVQLVSGYVPGDIPSGFTAKEWNLTPNFGGG